MATPWNNALTEDQEKLFKLVWENEVPKCGMAKSMLGELVRCYNRIEYDFYNNGLCNDKSYSIGFIRTYFDYVPQMLFIRAANNGGCYDSLDFSKIDNPNSKAGRIKNELIEIKKLIYKELKEKYKK